MMIRINLLPTRQVKRREMGKRTIALAATILIAALVGNYLWYNAREKVRASTAGQIKGVEAQVQELQKKIGEVDKLNARKKEVEEKLTVLSDLKKGRSGPVKMLDALARVTPKKVWLKSFKENSQKVTLEGTALNHEDVAEMMRSLTTVVWTPQGIGRLVDQQKETKISRVEMGIPDAPVQDFASAEVRPFFQAVDLQKAEQKTLAGTKGGASNRVVDFEIRMSTNYAI